MKYVQPYGEVDADAPYINGDPSIGRMGSIPPAAAFEHPMRELVSVIEFNKLAPSEADLKQVAKGIRSQRSNYAEDVSSSATPGWPNALIVALDPALTAYSIGLPLRVKVANTNTGTATINAGPGVVQIKKPNGAAVNAGDLPAGGLIELVYDGTAFQMINFGGAAAGGGGDTETFLVNMPYCEDTGTVNNIVANFAPPITALVPGTIFMVKIKLTNTGLTNINVNGLGLKPVWAQGGTSAWPLLPGDLQAGDVLIFTYDGTRFWIYANAVISQNTTFNVANNTQFDNLFIALGRKRIPSNVSVGVQMATGIWNPIITYHPDASRITVRGTMIAAAPVNSNFAKTGSSAAARAADSANNIAMLRSRYGTEIRFTNTPSIPAVYHTGPGLISFMDLLITGTNVHAGAGHNYIQGMAAAGGSALYAFNVAVWGSGGHGFVAANSQMKLERCWASSCAVHGFRSHFSGSIVTLYCGAYGNGEAGYVSTVQSSVQHFWQQGVAGIPDVPGSESIANGVYGIYQYGSSMYNGTFATITGNGSLDVFSTDMSSASMVSVAFDSSKASPVVNGPPGNYNSMNTFYVYGT